MAKGQGIIGNFTGKVGNMVGFSLKDSNNKQTQGIRIYQPVVRNPKSYAQAEQRARMAPINAFYRALKSIIDRGQEGVPYGNKSRLQWLSQAMKDFSGIWLEKGQNITDGGFIAVPYILTPITQGSLPTIAFEGGFDAVLNVGVSLGSATEFANIGALSVAIVANNSFIKEGDQITFVFTGTSGVLIESLLVDSKSDAALGHFQVFTDSGSSFLQFNIEAAGMEFPHMGSVILSRESSTGQHLRSTSYMKSSATGIYDDFEDDLHKQAAIRSYMAAGASTDWPQESLIDG